MKKAIRFLKSFLSIVLVLAMLAGEFPADAVIHADASEGEQSQNSGQESESKDVYNYIEDFSNEQGKNNWYYSSDDYVTYGKQDGSKFNDMSAASYWSLAEGRGTKFTKNTLTFASANFSGIMFVAPKAGKIKIEQDLSVTNVTSGVVKYSIYKLNADTEESGLVEANDVLAAVYGDGTGLGLGLQNGSATYKAYGNNETDSITKEVTVEAGQRILFHAVNTGAAGPVMTFSKFQITYQEEVYDYKEDFSNVQGQDGWYYNPSQAIGEKTGYPTTYFQDAKVWAAMRDGVRKYTEFSRDNIYFSNTNIASIMFESPRTGTLHIEETLTLPTGITTNNWLKHGVYKLDKDNNVLKAVAPESDTKLGLGLSGETCSYDVYYYKQVQQVTVDITVDIEAGQKILFVMQSDKSGVNVGITNLAIAFEDTAQGSNSNIKDSYNYIDEFSNTQGQDNWYYSPGFNNDFSLNSGAQFNDTSDLSYWASANSNGGTWLGQNRFEITEGAGGGAGVMFVAPKDGIIKIEQNLNLTTVPTAGFVKYGIYKADKLDGEENLDTIVTLSNADVVANIYPKNPEKLGVGFSSSDSAYVLYGTNGKTADVVNENVVVKQGDRIIFKMQSSSAKQAVLGFDTFKITYQDNVYDYKEDFSGVQGQDGWYYNPAQAGFDVNKFENNTWKHNTSANSAIYGADTITSPKASIGTIAFKVPQSGTVRIEQDFTVNGGNDGNMKYGIMKCSEEQVNGYAGTPLYPESMTAFLTTGAKVFSGKVENVREEVDFTTTVEAGEYIVFGFNVYKSTAYTLTLDTFKISYVDPEQGGGEGEGDGDEGNTPDLNKDVYDYQVDFSGTQGQDGWYYNPAQAGFDVNKFENNTWKHNTSANSAIYGADTITSPKASIGTIAFKVPQSGTVRIEQDFTVNGGNDGNMKYGIMKCSEEQVNGYAGTPLYPESMTAFLTTGAKVFSGKVENVREEVDFTTTVEAGEYIVFGFNVYKSTAYTLTLDTFKISYVDPEQGGGEGEGDGDEGYTPDLNKNEYDYQADFSGTQGNESWYYSPYFNNNFGTTNQAKYNGTDNTGYWAQQSGMGTKMSKDSFTSTDYAPAAIMFVAPKAGRLHIEQDFTVSGVKSGAYIKYSIYHVEADSDNSALTEEDVIKSVYPKATEKLGFTFNSKTSTYQLYSNGDRDIINKAVDVEAGDKIVFQMVSNGGAGAVIDIDSFKVTYDDDYQEPPAYEHKIDFSKTEQGPVWYYMSAEVDKNYFKELDEYNTTRQRWQTALDSAYITGAIGDHYLAPWVSHDAVLAFKAPYTGTIKIKFSNAYVYSKSKDGVNFAIQKGVEGSASENIYPSGDLPTWKYVKPGAAGFAVDQNLEVRKGEWIYFRTNANVTYTGDNFYINPCIQYLSVDKSDEGIKVLPDSSYLEEKEHTIPGHNMTATQFPMTGRTYSGSYADITATEFAAKLKAGELAAGGYHIKDEALVFDNTFDGKEIDASGIFVKTSKGVKFDEVSGLRVEELTVEVTDKVDALITTNSIRDVRLLGWQLSYSGSEGIINAVELVKTTGTASAGTKSDLVIDGLRFAGNGTVKGIEFTDSVHYATVKNSYITGVKDYAVKDSGSSVEGIYVGNCYLEGNVDINKESGVVRNNTIKGNIDIAEDFGMAAMNDVTGDVSVKGTGLTRAAKTVQSVFLVKNKVNGKMSIEHGKACSIIENEATEITVTSGEKCIVEDNNGAGKDNKPVASVIVDKDGTDHYGSNVYDQSVRNTVGVNEDLLPKNDNTLFVGRERKSYINDGGNIKPVSEYVIENAENGADVLLAPGAYSISGLKLTEKENLDLYFYCSLFEAPTSRTSYFNFMFTNSKYSSIRGMTAGYGEPALGQGTIVEVTNDYFIVESHPGYYPDLTVNDYYIHNFYCLTYREGSKTPSGYQNYGGKREYLGDGKTKFELTEELSDVKVGDTFACRVQGNRYMQYWDNTECLMEDVTAYVSIEAFAGDERGNKNYYNRPAAIPGFGYEVSETDAKFDYWKSKGWITEYEGKYYGPEAIWCVSNFMNANENTVGPQVTNYRANQRHDDAFNIHGVYCAVTDFDKETKTLTYDNSASDFGTWLRNIKVGDKLFVYFPATGEILCETTATSATVDHGTYRTVQVADSFETRLGAVLINNSAIGNGFVYDNCELKMSYPRGGVIKAGGTFKYCTFENTGKAAIMASPEIVDTTFCESGYTNGLNLLYNDIKNTNLMHALTDKNSSVSIYGHSENIDPGYAKHRDITIQGNRFENWGAHAIYIDSAENVKILDNIFVDAAAYDDERTPIYIAGSKNIEVSGNKFPSQYSGKEAVEIGGVNVKNVYGEDVGTVKCIADYIKVDSRSVYASDNWMIMIAVTNVSDKNISIGLDKIRCSLVDNSDRVADNVAPGETAKFYFPLKEMKTIPATANFVYNLTVNNDPELKLKNAKAEHVVFNILPNGKMNEEKWQTVKNENAGIEYDFNFWYDDENLYLKVIAKDDVHYQAETDLERIFYQDSIEFSVDPGRAKGNGAEGWSHYGVALNNEGQVVKYRWENTLSVADVSLMDATVTRDEEAKTTTYDIKVPWKLTGVNGNAPEEGDVVGLSICVDDADSASDEREYMKWYDIKSISNQAGFYIQKTDVKAYNINVENKNVTVSTPVALKGDKVYATFTETDKLGLKNWLINTENAVLNGIYATITVDEADIVVNAEEMVKEEPKTEGNEEQKTEASKPSKKPSKKPSDKKKDEAKEEKPVVEKEDAKVEIPQIEEVVDYSGFYEDYYKLVLQTAAITTAIAALMMISASVLLFMMMRKKKKKSEETK